MLNLLAEQITIEGDRVFYANETEPFEPCPCTRISGETLRPITLATG